MGAPRGVNGSGSAGEEAPEPLQLAKDKLYVPKSICFLSQLPAVACLERYLRELYTLSQQGSSDAVVLLSLSSQALFGSVVGC